MKLLPGATSFRPVSPGNITGPRRGSGPVLCRLPRAPTKHEAERLPEVRI
jgi:hypothetical protein